MYAVPEQCLGCSWPQQFQAFDGIIWGGSEGPPPTGKLLWGALPSWNSALKGDQESNQWADLAEQQLYVPHLQAEQYNIGQISHLDEV